jgi:hypothetical protein
MRLHLLDLLRKMNQPKRAYPLLEKILAARGKDPGVMLICGDIAHRFGNTELAKQCWQKVVALDDPKLAEMVRR